MRRLLDPGLTTLRILTTLAVKGVFDALRPSLEAAAGSPLDLVLEPTAVMLKRVADGERGDIAILTAEGIDRLIADGYALSDGRVSLFRSVVGLAVRQGAPKPDIATVDALVATLRAAPSLCYSKGGASGIFFAKLIDRLGIADAVNAKATVIPSGFTAEKVASGDCAMAVQQVSELMTVAGVDIVGPFPDGAQESLLFAGAIFRETPRRPQAEAVLRILADPKNAGVFAEKGLLPVAR